MERVASGYRLAEAPVAADDGGVVFADVLGGGVHRWSPATGLAETVVPKRRGVGGMAWHADGGLVMSGRDLVHVRDGRTRVIFAPEGAAGLNDLTADPDGRVVVGVLRHRPFAGESPVPGEFAAIGADGSATVVLPGVEWVNGCAFSPGGDVFYGCDYQRGIVLAADRRSDGTYGPPRRAAVSPSGEVDGMAVDETGALWVALGAAGAVGRFTPDGTLDGRVEVPGGFVTSLCFGGADGRDLFVTTAADLGGPGGDGAVFVTRVGVAGAPIAPVTL